MGESGKVGENRSGPRTGGVELRWFGSVRATVDRGRRCVVLGWSPALAPLSPKVRQACVKWAVARLAEDLPDYEIDTGAVVDG